MIGVLDIAMAVVAADVTGDELVLVVDAQVVGVELEAERGPGIFGRHRVGVGVHPHAELAAGPGRQNGPQVVRPRRQRSQARALGCEQLDGRAFGGAVQADVGHGVQPLPAGGIEVGKVAQLQAGQEVLLDVADGVFHAAFFVGLANATGGDGETVMVGKVLVTRVEDGRFADGPSQHGAFQVIDHAASRDAAEEVEGVDVGVQEVLHGLGEGELDIHHAAVAEHHDEEAETASGVAHGDRAGRIWWTKPLTMLMPPL